MAAGTVFHHTFGAMNTRFSLVLPDLDPAEGPALARSVEELVRSQETLMSRFQYDADVATLNRRAGQAPAPVSDALWDVLQTCRDHWRRTGGAFDAAQGARTASLRQGASGAASANGFDQLRFDADSRSIHFASPGLQLDLGGIGKGVALEQVDTMLRQRGVACAFLSFGESSISVIGDHPAGAPWPVGIADLFQPDRSLHCFNLRDAAMSTSGNRTGEAHIVDPRDGRALAGHRMLSVACASAVDAEVLSTALLVLPAAEREAVLYNYPGTEAIEIVYEFTSGTYIGQVKWRYES